MTYVKTDLVSGGRHAQLFGKFAGAMAVVAQGFDDVPAIDQLAVLCNLVGRLIALQDASKHSAEVVMELVARNIEQGNSEARDEYFAGNA